MERLQAALSQPYMQPVINAAMSALFFVAAFVIWLLLLHTAYLLGRRAFLYKRKPPKPGWSRQFYPASLLLLALVSFLAYQLSRFTSS